MIATLVGAAAMVAALLAGNEPAPAQLPGCAGSAAGAASAKPGDVVCLTAAAAGQRLRITVGGTADQPVTYDGTAAGNVRGIDVEADHVVVRNFTMDRPSAPGIDAEGTGITLLDNVITQPTGGDGDGIRFFGDDIEIRDNRVRGTDNSTGAHADCMQTVQNDTPSSLNVVISGNRCERIDNMCLMAEGPNDDDGQGRGDTGYFTITGNFCESLEASQNLMFENVHHVTIEGNTFTGNVDHAIGLDFGSTHARVGTNTLDPAIRCYVGISTDSREGYEGPEPTCRP
ncbi:right-handed parallel beta-helix repeat-containing protein [Actinomycetes bacterium KLBMP 9759]